MGSQEPDTPVTRAARDVAVRSALKKEDPLAVILERLERIESTMGRAAASPTRWQPKWMFTFNVRGTEDAARAFARRVQATTEGHSWDLKYPNKDGTIRVEVGSDKEVPGPLDVDRMAAETGVTLVDT